MRSHLVLVFGLLLSGCLPIEAQTPATQLMLAPAAPGLTIIASRVPWHRSSLLALPFQLPRALFTHPYFHFAATYKPESSFESRLQTEDLRTSFLVESNFLIARLWRGLHVDVFDRTLYSQSLQFGPSSGGTSPELRAPSHDQAGITSSVGSDGISLRYVFGGDSHTERQPEVWRCLAWIKGESRGCPL
jgi:hypothetical protein